MVRRILRECCEHVEDTTAVGTSAFSLRSHTNGANPTGVLEKIEPCSESRSPIHLKSLRSHYANSLICRNGSFPPLPSTSGCTQSSMCKGRGRKVITHPKRQLKRLTVNLRRELRPLLPVTPVRVAYSLSSLEFFYAVTVAMRLLTQDNKFVPHQQQIKCQSLA